MKRKTLLAVTGVGAALAMALSMPALADGYGHGGKTTNVTNSNNEFKTLTDVGNSFTDSSQHASLKVGNVSVGISTTTANTNLHGSVNASGAGINAGTGWGGPAATGILLSKAHTGHGAVGDTGAAYGGASGRLEVVNTISNTANGAGIMNVAQNMGASSLIQQGVTVQANMSFNH